MGATGPHFHLDEDDISSLREKGSIDAVRVSDMDMLGRISMVEEDPNLLYNLNGTECKVDGFCASGLLMDRECCDSLPFDHRDQIYSLIISRDRLAHIEKNYLGDAFCSRCQYDRFDVAYYPKNKN